MKSASIIIIPLIWEEPFGFGAAVAISDSIAIIASDIGGVSEVVKEGCFLIKNLNRLKLQNKLKKLINNNSIKKSTKIILE